MFFILVSSVLFSTTYYVRTDGGTATQCNGLADSPYPGSGENQNCAWAHPFWALDEYGGWKIRGGDTLIIGQGSYMIGYGAPNTSGWCGADWAESCIFPPIPSGNSVSPTKILGAGWNSGCSNPPELWATQRIYQVLSLDGTSNAEIQCLEITDHSSCVDFHSNPSVACSRNYPYGDWASNGIFANQSSNVLLKNLNIHGLAENCLATAGLSNWKLENVRLAGCGWAGWNGEYGENPSNSGTMHFKNLVVEWNGCAENYPGEQPDHCWAQSRGGYGDGVGFPRTGGNWIIEDSVFRYNTSDGLDLLYVGVGYPNTTIELNRVKGYGNAGNQIKLGGTSIIKNMLSIGNCSFFWQKPFAQEFGSFEEGDTCRAGGASVSINIGQRDYARIYNSTIASQGWALIEAQCITKDFPDEPDCIGTEYLEIKNSIFRGYEDYCVGGGNLTDFIGDGDPYHFTAGKVDYNILYNVDNLDFDHICPQGPHDICQNPLLVNDNLDSFDGHLKQGSPAIDKGTSGGAPPDDLDGNLRPQGLGIDIGAYEFVQAGEEKKYFIPASAKSRGAQGSNWVTDLMVLNNSTGSVNLQFIYTPSGQNGSTSTYIQNETVGSKKAKFFSDVLSQWFGLNNTAGSIRINTSGDVLITSRTYNDQGSAGTYGQFIPANREEDAIAINEKAYLIGIRQDELFRTNFGLSEVSGKETRVRITFYSSNGSSLGSTEINILPYSWYQQNVGQVSSIQNGFATVEVLSGGKILSYISIADNQTSDAIFVFHQKKSSVDGKKHQLIPVIARAQGGYGTNWKTSMAIYNQASSNQSITLDFYTSTSKYSKNLSLNQNNQISYEDLVSEVFSSVQGNASGSLHINSAQGLMISSRTYNDQGDEGTYGQFIPAWGEGSFLKVNESGLISQILSNSSFRTNMGFTEFEGKTTTLRVEIYSSEGTKLAEKNYTIDPFENLQVNGIFSDMGISGDVSYSYAKIITLSGGSIFAYASVVDNRTGDAICIPAKK